MSNATRPKGRPVPPPPTAHLQQFEQRRAEIERELAVEQQRHAAYSQQIESATLARDDTRARIHQLQGRLAELAAMAEALGLLPPVEPPPAGDPGQVTP